MLALLQQAVALGVLRPLDFQLARLFSRHDQPLLALAIAWLSSEVATGHVCLPLNWLTPTNLFNNRQPELAQQIWAMAGHPQSHHWLQAFNTADVVGDGLQATPFVLQDERFYLQRMWLDEGRVAEFFSQPSTTSLISHSTSSSAIKQVLNQLFDTNNDISLNGTDNDTVNWQKVAAAVAVTQQVAIISGGPGTGKTTTVAKLLAALIMLSETTKLRITLAAPTGKAAARLTESLGYAIEDLPLTAQQKALIPAQAATIHRLLGVRPNSLQLQHHQDNPLHLDVLVVDEASMIDLPMMARLIAALPKHAHFILLGDREQLASVEAGAVLGDICQFAEWGYSATKIEQLEQLTGYQLAANQHAQSPIICDSLCLLRKSYRFTADSGIGRLATAVNQGNSQQVLACFNQTFADIECLPLAEATDYQHLVDTCVAGYRDYLQNLTTLSATQILTAFSQFQLLCALRSGPFGVEGLNEQIEQGLIACQLIQKKSGYNNLWYAGRPVMVNRNDSSLGLYNGDIGIALYDENQELRVYFQQADGYVRSVQTNRLPDCETAFAMTVHKSQGSEFNHTVLVLPDTYSPLLTRELVYTAITRARHKLTLFANHNILLTAIGKPTERRSGLATRLLASDC